MLWCSENDREAVVWALYADITFLYSGFLVIIAFIEFPQPELAAALFLERGD